MSILSRRARVKELSNKAEGIFQYVGTDNVLFRLISTGNELTSDVNHAIALFTNFARSNQLPDTVTRSTIDSIYRRVGKLLCLVDIIHAAAGEQIMPEPYDSIDFCYMMEYREMLHEAVIRGMPDNYKGVYQNPYRIKLAKPAIAYEINGRFETRTSLTTVNLHRSRRKRRQETVKSFSTAQNPNWTQSCGSPMLLK